MHYFWSILLQLTQSAICAILFSPKAYYPPIILLQPNPANMSATSSHPATCENFAYTLPSSTLTLDIRLDDRKPIGSSSVSACLSGAREEARKQTPSSLVDGPFRYSAPAPAHSQFGIVGGVYVNELTWGDVVVVVQGLQEFYAEKRRYVGLIVYLQDERRGALGDAYVKPEDEGAPCGTGT